MASTVVAGTLAVFGLLYDRLVRHDRRVVAFAAVMVGTAAWTLGYSFQFASAEVASKRTWATVAMAGEAVVPAAWCTFALVYARRGEWLTRRRVGALWAIPAVTAVLAATNGAHGLVWSGMATAPVPDGAYLVLDATNGPWMLVHGAYSYLVAFAGAVIVIDVISRTRRVYRGQAVVLLAGITVPAGANLVSLAGIGPGAAVNLTPPSMAVLGGAFAAGIFRYRLFDLVPVARSSVVENMREGYVLLDEANEVVDLNAAARSLLDADDGPLLGRNARDAFGADLSVLGSFGDTGAARTVTITTGDPDDRRYVELTVSRVEADRAAGRLIAVRDVTDRIRIERRFRTLIEASSDVVLVLDEAGRIEYASPSVEQVLGYDPDTLADVTVFEDLLVEGGSSTDDADPGADAPSAAAATWRRVLDGTEADPATTDRIRFEVRVRTAGGEVRTIEAIARYFADDPAVDGIVINARDTTERKRRELELERTNERLDRFASFVSHDLRNPLNVAMGRLDLAIETGDDDHLRTVREQHDRMSTMIEDLLTMARDGRDVEEVAPVDLDAAAAGAWRTVKTGDASLVADTGRTILADDSRLANLFENLYRNAIEHGVAADGPPVTVRVEATPEGFAVADDGVGIPPDVRGSVTESGYTTRGGNTGYGLAIVEEVATAHGWELTVTESDAGGARFAFAGVGPDGDAPADDPDAARVEPGASRPARGE